MKRGRSTAALILCGLLLPALSIRADERHPSAVETADALWSRRAEGHQSDRAAIEPIRSAIELYETRVRDHPDDMETRFKLLRAIYFYAEHALTDAQEKLSQFNRGRALAEESRQELHRQLGLRPEEDDVDVITAAAEGDVLAARIYLYAAIHWGLWGENTGKVKAARQGVGGRLRDYGEVVVGIDDEFDSAGGLRFLGRLHSEAPKIPFVTGWVDRVEAVALLDRACELAPHSPANQVYLADALLRFESSRSDEAIGRLERVVATPPSPEELVEDLAIISEARTLLAERE